MTADRAPHIEIVPLVPLCFKCIGPRGDSIIEPFEDRRHPFCDDGSVNEDDVHHWIDGGEKMWVALQTFVVR